MNEWKARAAPSPVVFRRIGHDTLGVLLGVLLVSTLAAVYAATRNVTVPTNVTAPTNVRTPTDVTIPPTSLEEIQENAWKDCLRTPVSERGSYCQDLEKLRRDR